MLRALLLVLALVLAPALVLAAPRTDLEKALKKVQKKYGEQNPFTGKFKAFCVCNDGSISNDDKLGILLTNKSTIGGGKRIDVDCLVLAYDNAEKLVALLSCEPWFPLTK